MNPIFFCFGIAFIVLSFLFPFQKDESSVTIEPYGGFSIKAVGKRTLIPEHVYIFSGRKEIKKGVFQSMNFGVKAEGGGYWLQPGQTAIYIPKAMDSEESQ